MSTETVFIVQAIGVVGIGAFVGEFYRGTSEKTLFSTGFFAALLASAFLSFLIAYLVYYFTENRPISLIIGGLLAYQEETYIGKTGRSVLKNLLDSNSATKQDNEREK